MTITTRQVPEIALSLSFDGIALLRRAGSEWKDVDAISLSPDTLDKSLKALHSKAKSESETGDQVQLFIPLEQIKFLTFDNDPSWDQIELIEQILKHLDGTTPYALADLRYDHCVVDGIVYVAAIAIETLEEAEGFAKSYGFDPLGSGAMPDADTYPTHPYFGLAEDAHGRMIPLTQLPETLDTPVAETADTDHAPTPAPEQAPEPLPLFASKRKEGAVAAHPTLIAAAPPVDADLVGPKADTQGPVALFFRRAKPARPLAPLENKPAPIVIPNTRAPSADLRNDADKLTLFGKRAGQVGQDRRFAFSRASIAALVAFLLFTGGAVAYYLSASPEADTDIATLAPLDQGSVTSKPNTPVSISLPPADSTPRPDATLTVQTPETAPELPTPTVTYSAQDIQRIYAASGIWPSDPPAPVTTDPAPLGNVYIASIDPNVAIQDAIALDALPDALLDRYQPNSRPPAPAGTVFELDDQGLVRATPQGAAAPDGHLVYLGKPTKVPPTRPELEKAEDTVIGQTTPLLSTSGAPLIDLRPRARPEIDVITQEAEQANDALRLLRPRPKPASIEQLAADAAATNEPAVETASLAPAPDGSLAEVLKPKVRPKNLNTATAPQKTAVIAPEDEGEEANAATPAPNIPTNAKVSKEATIKNALKLNKVNLIGVFGTGSKKRALIRLSNGKRQMVSVGDKLDGGKVAAIGDGELRYVKGGQNVVLKLPKG
ncbi:MAG: hypothetical protein EBU18_04110 [Rhodobacteraceae bacterium]|nr:hypothetical protein [Paracoccaceae bacterium]